MRIVLVCETCGHQLGVHTIFNTSITKVELCPVCSKRIADTAHAEGCLDAEEHLTEAGAVR